MKNNILRLFCLSLISLFSFACQNEKESLSDPRSNTEIMADTLEYLVSTVDPLKNYYESRLRAQYYLDKMNTSSPREKGKLMYLWFKELINAGENKQAITAISNFVQQLNLDINNMDKNSKLIFELLALSHLRDGELENCQANHTGESCIFPLAENSIHQNRQGSTEAIKIYEKILAKFPDDLYSRWLLNVAYVTLGEYPEKVPSQWLIEGLRPNQEGPIQAFKNVATGMGIDVNELSGSVIADDFDNDGLLDIFISSWEHVHPLRLFRNNGDGTFTERTEMGLDGINGGLNIVSTDYNNDGLLDIFVMRGAWLEESGTFPNSLIKNNGDGTFEDVTYSSGLFSLHPTQAASWADFNNDGWIDVFIANETVDEKKGKHPCELYLNNQNGTFTNIAKQAGIAIEGYFKGCTAGDINNDGWTDLYLSNLDGSNYLFINKGGNTTQVTFENITQSAKVEGPSSSFPTWIWDYNNDGLLDIFVSTYYARHMDKVGIDEAIQMLNIKGDIQYPKLYKNIGNNKFADVTEEVGLNRVMFPMGSNFGDLDNDGFPDFYLGTGAPDLRSVVPNLTFYNHQGARFEDITYSSGMGHIQKGHGVAFADFDNDGDQDIYTVMGGAYPGDFFFNTLFENPNEQNNWVTLKLEGTTSNRAAIGARIKVSTRGEAGEKQDFFAVVNTGGSFGCSSLQQEIGLGNATNIDAIEIIWPNKDRSIQKFANVSINKRYHIIEGSNELSLMNQTAFSFTPSEGHHHHHQH